MGTNKENDDDRNAGLGMASRPHMLRGPMTRSKPNQVQIDETFIQRVEDLDNEDARKSASRQEKGSDTPPAPNPPAE